MSVRVRGIGSVVAVAAVMLCAGIGSAGSASAEPPWGTHCKGAKAEAKKEKPFIIQACQRAYSAKARAIIADDATKTDATTKADAAADAHTADDATDAAFEAAQLAAKAATSSKVTADAAVDAAEAARAARDEPMDVALANKAAEAEEKAVAASRKAFGGPGQVKIPRLTSAG
ncbi:hypothetical protein [Nocardia terpenica]|uniref:hypothetical protein n=1 Tax=Nocardia terpenica TaxID=455432 RepID=UPI000A48C511|nr:hypothetical protein [Nocardia terpenica]NQE88933.1 hypothetical protein [Nocardia terpenica]